MDISQSFGVTAQATSETLRPKSKSQKQQKPSAGFSGLRAQSRSRLAQKGVLFGSQAGLHPMKPKDSLKALSAAVS